MTQTTISQAKTTQSPAHNLPTPARQLVTVKQLAAMIPAYQGRPGAIRWHIFNSSTNGLKETGAIIRSGRRIIIDAEKYIDWLSSNVDQ